ncbi:hypothetical protein FIBSPDRAFT_158935 [Athelia psychrophila]|uniref:Uncharacterized protein n=1 Tax=Athelia psychrophila TaxID=1759441 RepID=A0A166STP7_9AGAM|nr:hypothetical protein FIBSPDRAFT_158935 [Fibularhizoctonia sp. CBS 109695]
MLHPTPNLFQVRVTARPSSPTPNTAALVRTLSHVPPRAHQNPIYAWRNHTHPLGFSDR